MSVVKSKREESTVQFLDNAIDLQVYTLKQCIKFPKRYMFLLTNGIIELARNCLFYVKSANSIFPRNEHEAQMRRDYFIKANACVMNLYTQLDIAYECIDELSEKTFVKWIELARNEEKLIKAVMKSDLKRSK